MCLVPISLLCVAASPLFAQAALRGEALAPASEIRAILTALRSISQTERIELNFARICRTDIVHPDCPAKLKESGFNGRLPGSIYLNARDQLNSDEHVGKHHSSLRSATIVSIQRPVILGDSIVMLAQVLRPVEGEKRDMSLFDIVLRGDSLQMQTVRFTKRADPRLREIRQ
jgi:hypothetical protein